MSEPKAVLTPERLADINEQIRQYAESKSVADIYYDMYVLGQLP